MLRKLRDCGGRCLKAAAVAVLVALLCGCAAPKVGTVVTAAVEPTPIPQSLRVCLGPEGHTIDPAYLREETPGAYLYHMFEGLVKYAPTESGGEVVLAAGLAERWEVSADGLTYTFYLRENARWSDGAPIVAEDFVYAWRRLVTQGANTQGGQQLLGVLRHAEAVAEGALPAEALGVRAEGGKVLVAELEAPCGHFPALCGDIAMVPVRRDLVEAYGGDWTCGELLVVSGPYTVAHWVRDDTMTLVKNPYYYGAEDLGPDEIIWDFHRDAAEAYDVALADEASVRAAKGETYFLYLNANGICDWRVRAAMLLSIDREALARRAEAAVGPTVGLLPRIGEAEAQPMYAWLGAAYPSYDVSSYEGRCELARHLYGQALAGGSWYRSYTIYQRYDDTELNGLVAERCKSDWERVLGLRTELVPMETEAYEKMLRTNTFDVAYGRVGARCHDGVELLRLMERGGAQNFTGWGDVRYNELLSEIWAEADAARRQDMTAAGEAWLFQEGNFAVCPLLTMGTAYSVGENVTGLGFGPDGSCCLRYIQLLG